MLVGDLWVRFVIAWLLCQIRFVHYEARYERARDLVKGCTTRLLRDTGSRLVGRVTDRLGNLSMELHWFQGELFIIPGSPCLIVFIYRKYLIDSMPDRAFYLVEIIMEEIV